VLSVVTSETRKEDRRHTQSKVLRELFYNFVSKILKLIHKKAEKAKREFSRIDAAASSFSNCGSKNKMVIK
jgi:hypothetical protein